MKDTESDRRQFADLRKQAEELLLGQPLDAGVVSSENILRLLHELQVHQIELEVQNEELRRTQQELEASRDRYSDLYDLAPVGYLTVSEKGLIVEANLTVAILLGVERSALAKQPLSRFIARDDQDAFYFHRRRTFETGTTQTAELRMVKADDTLFYARL
ncbi:MAG: PAS domain-containing protein, partial [Planctomycetota bacterium]